MQLVLSELWPSPSMSLLQDDLGMAFIYLNLPCLSIQTCQGGMKKSTELRIRVGSGWAGIISKTRNVIYKAASSCTIHCVCNSHILHKSPLKAELPSTKWIYGISGPASLKGLPSRPGNAKCKIK